MGGKRDKDVKVQSKSKMSHFHKLTTQKQCRFWTGAVGSCTNGDVCGFSHGASASRAVAVRQSASSAVALRQSASTMTTHHQPVMEMQALLQSLTSSTLSPHSSQTVTIKRTEVLEKQVPMEPRRKPFQVLFLVDDSGSMSGCQFAEACEGVRAVISELKQSDDWAGIATFSEVRGGSALRGWTEFRPLRSKKGELLQALAEIEGRGARGGSTALYSAMIEAASHFKAYSRLPELQHLLVVVTDGGNNVGDLTAEDVNRQLHSLRDASPLTDRPEIHINLHVTVLPIALPESLHAEMGKMLTGHPPTKGGVNHPKLGEVCVCKDATVVKEVFSAACRTVFESVETTVGVQQTSTSLKVSVTSVVLPKEKKSGRPGDSEGGGEKAHPGGRGSHGKRGGGGGGGGGEI